MHDPHPPLSRRDAAAFLEGGGATGALLRARDWSDTALGPAAGWPQPLKTLVGVMLAAGQPMFVAWGPERVLLYNDAYSALLADRHPRALGRPFLDVWSEVKAELAPLVDRVFAGEPVHMDDIELHLDRPGRPQEAHFAFSYTPVRDEAGAVAGLFCPCTETTDQVLAERARRLAVAALAESEARFRNMADHAPVMMWVTDPQGHCTYMNRRWYEFTGQGERDGEGLGWVDAVHPDDRPLAEHAFLTANAERRDYRVEFRLRRADGAYRWTIDAAAARFGEDDAFLGYVGSVIDIDERREAERALRASIARAEALAAEQAAILGQLAEGVIVTDRAGRITFVNDAAARIHGVQRLDVEPEAYSETYRLLTLDGQPYPPHELPLARAVLNGETVSDARWRIRRPDGAEVLAVGNARPVLAADGERTGAVLTVRDDTARAAAEAALRELNRTLERRVAEAIADKRMLAEVVASTDGIVTGLDLRYDITAGNAAFEDEFERLYGVRPKAGDNVLKLLADRPAERDAVRAGWERALAGEEFTVVREFGDPRLDRRAYEVKFRTLRSETGERIGAYQFVTDVSERLRAQVELEQTQEQLRQAQKMEAVGQLTGGIAHDFNNLLTGIIGSLDMMQRRLARGETDKVERYATAAVTSANRAAALTHRLLAFSRRQPLDPKPVDANRLVTGMEDLLRRTIGEAVRLEIVTAGGLWRTLCDPHQLESAILNLAINARDAMPDGGALTIETCNARLDDAYAARDRDVRPGQYVCVCVTDTGAGMSKEVIAKAFEPFFTTKPIGQGTGLGLSMIYGFARQSEGYAKIYSEPGQGTTVKLYLPRHYGDADAAGDGEEGSAPPPRSEHGEVVLVVEDETAVRDLVVDVLEELGYRAVEAADGPTGLKLLQSGMRVDLLVTDVGLPGLNGRQLADAARAARPGLPVLFMTGYAENAAVAGGFLDPGMAMITKPFAVDALATRLRAMMADGVRP